MRQFLLFMTAILLTCCSSDCEVMAETNQYQTNMAKTLIVYYSYTGNCKAIVNSLASQITADQLEIQPAEKGLRYEANNYALGTQLLIIPDASHCDLYDGGEKSYIPFDKLEAFFRENLK